MLDELAPLGLAACARRLGLSPFELVRTAVAAGEMPTGVWLFDEARIAKLAPPGNPSSKASKARTDKG